MIEITWVNNILKKGWRIPIADSTKFYAFSKESLKNAPRDLRQKSPQQLLKDFSQFANESDFFYWWLGTCGGAGEKSLNLRFPRDSFYQSFFTSAWDIPWELLIHFLKNSEVHANVSLVRTLSESVPLSPSAFDEPLQVLILKGHRGREISRRIDVEEEARKIKRIWDSLDKGAQQCINKPVDAEAKLEDLPKLLRKYKPHIIWFSGHGRSEPDSSLLFAEGEDGQWVTASQFAEAIKEASREPSPVRPPLYAVFWACDTGRPDASLEAPPVSPALFDKLSNAGVIGVLTMQSPIQDKNAKAMSRSLFEFLASGLSLERAVARSRARLIDDSPSGDRFADWAAPVVWNAGNIVERLVWNSPAQALTQFQLWGKQSLRWQFSSPSELNDPPSPYELEIAETWLSNQRVWFVGDVVPFENQKLWVRALQAVQVLSDQFVIAIDLNGRDTAQGLQDWASILQGRLLPGDFPEIVAKIVDQIKRNPTVGWKNLCKLPNIHIAVSEPPAFTEDEWFWKSLAPNEKSPRLAVFSSQLVSADIQDQWSLVRIGSDMDMQAIKIAIDEAPRLARALAVLNMPLSSYLIKVEAEQNEGVSSFSAWQNRDRVIIETSAGPILTATARHYVLKDQSPELLKQAHYDCAKMLDQPEVFFTTKVCEKMLEHLLGANLTQAALSQALELFRLYRAQDRPSSVLHILERIRPLWTSLPAVAKLVGAWALSQLGKPTHSRILLQSSFPQAPLDKAWKHGLQAEIYKSEGSEDSKQKALDEIDAAIEICRNAQPDDETPAELIQKRLRAYRQDRARILQFLFYRPDEAAEEYRQLIKEWINDPEAVIDIAVVKRNYAECLRFLAGAPKDQKNLLARDMLQEAEMLVRDYRFVPVYAEIIYEKAKLAEAENRRLEAYNLLIECKKAALESGHYMLLAIVESRLFWKDEQFSLSRWEELEAELEGFPNHGWAVRTLVNSRLRAAKKLEELQDTEGAFRKLKAAQNDMQRNPSFDEGSDRFRIAAILSGLQLIGRDDSYWNQFIHDYAWAEEWLKKHGATTPESIWAEVR